MDSAIQISTHTCCQDHIDGADAQRPDEQTSDDGNPQRAQSDAGRPRHGEHRTGNQRHDSGTDAAESFLDVDVFLELLEEHGDEQDGDNRRKRDAHRAHDTAPHTEALVPDVRGHVHGKEARHGLRHGEDVQKVLATQPLMLVHHLALHDRHHRIAPAEGEGTDLEEGEEKLYHFFSSHLRALTNISIQGVTSSLRRSRG